MTLRIVLFCCAKIEALKEEKEQELSFVTTIFRFQLLKEAFQKKYGEEPSFYCRAPGRVNIIGKPTNIQL